MLRAARRQPLTARGRYRYSNLGAAIAGLLLARAARASDYGTLLTDRILAPLGMNATGVAPAVPLAPPGRSALGARQRPWIMGGYGPAGGVVSTIADMARLAAALLDETAPGVAALRALARVPAGRGEREMGMFWHIDVRPGSGPVAWHNGQTGGYGAMLAVAPRARRAVVVLLDVGDAAAAGRVAFDLAP